MKMISTGMVAKNKKAHFNYQIGDTYEAGIILKGAEVKSIRKGSMNISEAFVVERNGELWLNNSHIPEYQGGVLSKFDSRAQRKLLLHRKEINEIIGELSKNGNSVVPLELFFNKNGIAKVIIGIGSGKKQFDKRQDIANREWKRDQARILKSKQYD